MAWVEEHGNTYRVRYRHDRGIITDSTHTDRDTARLRAAQLEAIKRQTATMLYGPAPTLQQWVSTWLPSHICSPVTRAKYESMLRVHILPAFGHMRIDTIDKNQVKQFAGVLKTRLKDSSARSVVTVLGTVIRDAIDDHHALYDPTSRLRLTSGPLPKRPQVTADQLWQIACRMPTLATMAMVIACGYTGMRYGELAALDHSNVDLDHGVLHIDPDVGSLHQLDGRLWLGPPKTPASARAVDLPPFLVHGLRLVLGGHDSPTVFCAEDGGWLDRDNFRHRYWRPACDGHTDHGWNPILNGLRIQDLRHNHRTWMDDDNIREVLAAERLGHILPDIRARYGNKVTPRMRQRLVKKLQQRWDNSNANW